MADRYRLLGQLGQGLTATTWRAQDCVTHTPVAIKEISCLPGDHAGHRRARREAAVLSQLDSPGIPTLREHFFTQQGRYRALCLVEDLIPGLTLQEERKQRRYSVVEILDTLEALLGTLTYLHERSPPVVHRDIKPANIIRHADSGAPILIDFSAVCDEAPDPDLGSMTTAGTFGYMAPEQLQGRAEPRTDLYALGVLAVTLLTRREPHTLLDHTHTLQWEPLVQLAPRTRGFLRRLLAPTPAQRYPSARAARSALRAARSMLDGQQQQRVQPPTPAPDNIEHLLRRIVREELQEALAQQTAPPPPTTLPPLAQSSLAQSSLAGTQPVLDAFSVPHPVPQDAASPIPVRDLPLSRRGWWEARPLTVAERQRPTHPAVQLVLTTGLFGAVAVGLQLVLAAVL